MTWPSPLQPEEAANLTRTPQPSVVNFFFAGHLIDVTEFLLSFKTPRDFSYQVRNFWQGFDSRLARNARNRSKGISKEVKAVRAIFSVTKMNL